MYTYTEHDKLYSYHGWLGNRKRELGDGHCIGQGPVGSYSYRTLRLVLVNVFSYDHEFRHPTHQDKCHSLLLFHRDCTPKFHYITVPSSCIYV